MTCETPVVLVVYNRPDTTARVLDSLARVEPETLYVIGDGPNDGDESDRERVRATRALVEDRIDWSCEIHRRYR
ncbi:MAG: hypothetical protein QXG03_13390 [Halalkalicoccus sp.]